MAQGPGEIRGHAARRLLAAQRFRAGARAAVAGCGGDRPQPVAGQVVKRVGGAGRARRPELSEQLAELLLGLAVEDGRIAVALELAERIQQQQWLVSRAFITARPPAHLCEPLRPVHDRILGGPASPGCLLSSGERTGPGLAPPASYRRRSRVTECDKRSPRVRRCRLGGTPRSAGEVNADVQVEVFGQEVL